MGIGIVWVVVLLTAALALRAELKIRPLGHAKSTRAAAASEAVPGARRHYLVPEGRLAAVLDEGAVVVARLPGTGYVVTAETASTDAQQIDPASKLSSDISDTNSTFFVVEFFPDTDAAAAETVVLGAGFVLYARPDLAPNHLLVAGDPANLPDLVRLDEVAYVFPASADLVRGEPVYACLNEATGAPGAGQYIATYGDGWDGPGRGSAALTYSFQALTEKLPPEQVKDVFVRALAEWEKSAAVSFSYTGRIVAARNVNVLFAPGNHGDEYPFDGPGKVLAHTFFPSPPNAEPIAGDMHLDAGEAWQFGGSIDLFSVVLHELGHALGLGHSDNPNAVMYPYYRRFTSLAVVDIYAVQALYAAPASANPEPAPLVFGAPASFTTTASTADLQGSVSGGTGDVRVTWSTDRGQSGTAAGGRQWSIQALPLTVGSTTVTLNAADSAGKTAAASLVITRTAVAQPKAPEIRIVGDIAGANNTRTISGTASHASGICQVTWSVTGGATGTAAGTTNWTATVPLPRTAATLRVTAVSNDGTLASASVTLAPAPAHDRSAPIVTIASPSGSTVTSTLPAVAITGTASDNSGVVQVRWSTNTGLSGIADGTDSWRIESVPLYVGYNVVTIRAVDAAGNTGWRAVAITRTN